MSDDKQWFQDIETVVADPLRFKDKLAIGEDAYTSLRMKNAAFEMWDVLGVGATGASIAKSSVVASTFFAPTGFAAALGFGTAITPVGWVIAASVVTGGAWFGISRYFKSMGQGKVSVIPKFINTPLDVLGVALFDLIAPLSLKVAEIDGSVSDSERALISRYFVKEWGFDPNFVARGAELIASRLDDFQIKDLASTLAEFVKTNPDCNYKSITQEIESLLKKIAEIDGRVSEREEMAVERVQRVFKEVGSVNFRKKAQAGLTKAKSGLSSVRDAAKNYSFRKERS